MVSRSDDRWVDIEPGDIGFDQGGGIVGFLIRHFSHSPYAHCWVYHERDAWGDWSTAEAYPGGLKYRERQTGQVHRVIRPWRNEEERAKILAKSTELVGAKYNYRELFRIIHYRLRNILMFLLLGFFASALLWLFYDLSAAQPFFWALAVPTAYAALPLKTNLTPDKVICSNHVAQSVRAARPDVYLKYEPQSIWPGRLERDLNILVWNDAKLQLPTRPEMKLELYPGENGDGRSVNELRYDVIEALRNYGLDDLVRES
jgi:hypothetical protein